MTAQWKRRAQRAEEQEALAELAAYDPLALEKVGWGKCDCDVDCGRWYDTDGMKWNEVPPSVFALAREVIRYRYAAMIPDPRGRVRFIRPARSHIICGRCGQPALSEATPTILEHYTEAHGAAPRQMVLGRFEERCEVTR